MERIFGDTIPDQASGLRATLAHFPADLILTDDIFAGTLPLLLDSKAERPAIAVLGITFLILHRDDGAPPALGLPPTTEEPQIAEYRKMMDAANSALFEPIRARVNGILSSMHVPPLPLSFFDSLVTLPDCFFHTSAPEFEYPRRDLPKSVRFVGALRPPTHYELPTDIAEALSLGRRVVLVTQGTLANFDFSHLVAPTLEALADRDDVVVLVSTGGRPVSEIAVELPSNARVAPFLPYDLVMNKTDVLVTNGCFGTVTNALGHGVPMVVAGTTEDKAEVAARVAWSGTGIDLRTEQPTSLQLRSAIDSVLSDNRYRDRAAEMGRAFARYDAADEITSLISETVASRNTQTASPRH